jgi:MYXO-CTERM domain-containing protein
MFELPRNYSYVARRWFMLAGVLGCVDSITACDAFLGIEVYDHSPQSSVAGPDTSAELTDGGDLDGALATVSNELPDAADPGVVNASLEVDGSVVPTSLVDSGSTEPFDALVVSISVEADIPGYPTQLRGKVTYDLPEPPSLKWSIIAAPSGVDIGTLVLSEDYVANPTFVAVRGGNHAVQLEANWESGETAVQMHQFSVPTTPIVLMNAAGDDSSFSTSPSIIRSDGTRLLTIGDQIMGSATNWSWLDRYDTDLTVVTRAHYPVDGQPVLVYPAALSGQSAEVRVATATTNASLGEAQFSAISPSGARVAFTNDEMNSLFTLGVDGQGLRVIDTRVEFDPFSPSPPFWLDETHLAWIELTPGETTFDMFTTVDTDDAAIQQVMACPSGTSDAFVVTAQLESTVAGLIALDDDTLWRMKSSGGTYQCSKSNPLNEQLYTPASGNEVFEFAVSPNRSQLLFVVEASDRSSSILRMDPATGGTATMVAADGAHQGAPHFIANGRQVVWTRRMPPSGHPESVELWRMNVDGTRKVMIYRRQSTPERLELTSSIENRARCSVTAGARPSRAWVGALILVAVWTTRRRRGGSV